MCVLKKHVSVPFDTAQDHPGLYRCELCQWFVTESRRRVVSVLFLQSNNTFLCVSLDDMKRDADEGGRAVWLLLSWVASFLFVLFDLCMKSNKTLAVFPHPFGVFLSLFLELNISCSTPPFSAVQHTATTPVLSLACHPQPWSLFRLE